MVSNLAASAKIDVIGESNAKDLSDGKAAQYIAGRQEQAWNFYRQVGELRYSARFVGACLSRCQLTIGIRDEKGDIAPAFDENGDVRKDENGTIIPGLERAEEALAYLRALRNDVDDQSSLLGRMGPNIFIAGEFLLVGSNPNANGAEATGPQYDGLAWEVLSTREFRRNGDEYRRIRYPGAAPEEIKADQVHAVRIWRSDPEYSELPDSSVFAVMDILEELVLLTREVRGEALSRLTNSKVLAIPIEIEASDDDADDGQGEEGDALVRDIIETMVQPINDKGSAAQGVPYILRAPAELIRDIKDFDLGPTNSSDSAEKRKEAIIRLAQGIDLPVEIVTGHMNTTFSNAVQIDDSLFKSHIEPVLDLAVGGLTVGYLHPALGDPNSRLVIHYDSSELVARPNKAQDAKDAYDRFELSGSALRTNLGFSDADKPDDDELAERIRIKQMTNLRQTVQETPQQEVALDKTLADPNTPLPAGVAAPGAPIQQGPLQGNNTDKALAASIQAAAEVTIERALWRAGARLRSKANKDAALRSTLSQIPDPEVWATLGPSEVARLNKDDLFQGEFDVLRNWAARMTGDQDYAAELAQACGRIASERLKQPRVPMPYGDIPLPHVGAPHG